MLPSIPHAFATTAEFWCVNRWCKGSYESKDKKKSIFLTLINEVKPLVINFSEIHDWVTTFGRFLLAVQVCAAMSARITIRSGCVARLRKAGKEAGWSNYFCPDLPLLSKVNYKATTSRKYSAFAHPKIRQHYKIGRFSVQFSPCLFVMHRWERGIRFLFFVISF